MFFHKMLDYGGEDRTFFKPHKQVKLLLYVKTSGKDQPQSCDYFSIVFGLLDSASETTSVNTVENTKVIYCVVVLSTSRARRCNNTFNFFM